MSFNGNRSNFGYNGFGGSRGNTLLEHMCEFIGETVTIFTTSGGASGCGFTGVLISVNPCFVRLVTEQGFAPANPLAENICGDLENGPGRGHAGGAAWPVLPSAQRATTASRSPSMPSRLFTGVSA